METTEGQISTEENVVEESHVEEMDTSQELSSVESESHEEVETGEVEAPAYEPNFKFKVHGEEKEFDEFLRPLVTDKETEDRIRDFAERAYGIDHVKADRETLREKLNSVQPEVEKYGTLSKSLNALQSFVDQGNYDAFFQNLKIPEHEIMNWAAKRLQYSEMTPEQKQEYDRQVDVQQQNVYQGQTLDAVRAENWQLQYDKKMFELDQATSSPEISQAAQVYDQRFGEAGKFRQAVIDRGLYHHTLKGIDIPVSQAVSEVLAMSGLQGQQAVAPVTQVTQSAAPPQAAAKKPVIPNIEGSGLSATKKRITSIKQLKDLSSARSGF